MTTAYFTDCKCSCLVFNQKKIACTEQSCHAIKICYCLLAIFFTLHLSIKNCGKVPFLRMKQYWSDQDDQDIKCVILSFCAIGAHRESHKKHIHPSSMCNCDHQSTIVLDWFDMHFYLNSRFGVKRILNEIGFFLLRFV